MSLSDYIEQVWLVTCSRCKSEGQSYTDFPSDAEAAFAEYGWTVEQVEGTYFTGDPLQPHVGRVWRVFCPRCNGRG